MNNTLRGKLAYKGERGYSAYEIAIKNGFVGSEKDWLAQLGTSSHFERTITTYESEIEGQTEFVLPDSYVTNSFIDVYIEGERLGSDEYTLNEDDKKIILTNGLDVVGTKVEVVILLISTSALPIVEELTTSATNDVVLGAEGLLKLLPANVKYYGAVGDGVTDDTNAFKNAIASGKREIFVPAGDYLITSTIVVPSGVKIYGELRGHYSQSLAPSSTLIRKSNITILSLSGLDIKEDQTDASMCKDVQVENITLRSVSDDYFDTPKLKTYRAVYFVLDKVVFAGNGKALHLGAYTFDSRIINCDFVKCSSSNQSVITTENVSSNEYHDAVFQGINQIIFDSCRWEEFENSVLELNNYSREMNFFACKFEGTLKAGNGLIKFNENNGDIFMYGTRVTLLANSTVSTIIQANKLNTFKADITYCGLCPTVNPLLIVENSEGIDVFIKVNNVDGSKVTTKNYIQNTNTTEIEVRGNLEESYYKQYANLYSVTPLSKMQSISFKREDVMPSNGKITKSVDVYVDEYSAYLVMADVQGGNVTGGSVESGASVSNSYVGVYSCSAHYQESTWTENKTTFIDKQIRSWSAELTNESLNFSKVNGKAKQLTFSADVNFTSKVNIGLKIIRLG